MKAELDFSIYSTKADLKIATVADTSEFAKKADLASLKFEGDNLVLIYYKTYQPV